MAKNCNVTGDSGDLPGSTNAYLSARLVCTLPVPFRLFALKYLCQGFATAAEASDSAGIFL